MKFAIRALFTALLITFSLAAQDKPPDKTAIVDSFKQKIQDFVNSENSAAGPEHAKVNSIDTPHSTRRKRCCIKTARPVLLFILVCVTGHGLTNLGGSISTLRESRAEAIAVSYG